MTALFEADKSRLCERIADAERAVGLRTRDLFQSPEDHHEERKALEAAQCALSALRAIYKDQFSTRIGQKLVNDAPPKTYAAA